MNVPLPGFALRRIRDSNVVTRSRPYPRSAWMPTAFTKVQLGSGDSIAQPLTASRHHPRSLRLRSINLPSPASRV